MNIVIFNWRDLEHPKAGGAEVVTHALASGLAQRGHRVTWFTSRHPRASEQQERDGYAVVRRGGELTCRFHALAWLRRRSDEFDAVVDEVNTLPFLSRFATRRPVILWLHQLAREVWLAEAPPIVGRVGYAFERPMLALYRGLPIVTGAASSARSFAAMGLAGATVIPYPLPPPDDLSRSQPEIGRVGCVGRVAASKRIDHIIRALAIVREQIPEAELIVIGGGPAKERRRLEALARNLGVERAVTFTGRVSRDERDALMRSFDVLAMASLREGWGLVVSEAARFCVPSVVYPVAGLIDSVQDGVTGLVTVNQTPEALDADLMRLIEDRALRDRLGNAAAEYLLSFSEERFVGEFERLLAAATAGKSSTSCD
ncbi:MAG TPA: glycosyltransferase family 4 protein [Candidatus Tyrphobacter sp.]